MNKEELRATLVRELFSAGDAARTASESHGEDLPHRVHRFRKALRRARATLDLVAEAIPSRVARGALRTFRDARRALGDARDHTVAAHVVTTLALDEVHRATVTQILAGAVAPDPAGVEQTLRAGAATCVAQIEEVGAQIPPALGWSVPRDGLRRIYREARNARIDAKDDQRAFHTWRRRTKELSYQLDLLAQLYPGVTVYAGELEPLIDAQSVAVDLIMLIGFLQKHGEATPADVLASVIAQLEQQTAAQMKLARAAGRAVFHEKPKAYVRAIRQAISTAPTSTTT